MLFERRAYTLRPGVENAYWKLQLEYNTPQSFKPLLNRNLGYFSTQAGPSETIVHLYCWDSYEEEQKSLAAIVTPERMPYFLGARKLLTRQETMLLDCAPLPELNPIWGDDRTWRPGDPVIDAGGSAEDLVVTESVLEFQPGGLLGFWEAYKNLPPASMDKVREGLIATLHVLTGPLHQVIHYHWHRDWPQAASRRRALVEDAGHSAFMEAVRPTVVGSHVTHLKPSPVPWLRRLFEPIDWSL